MPKIAGPVNSPIRDGDMGLVIKPDGQVQVFTIGDSLTDPAKLTKRQLDNLNLLRALALVMHDEELLAKALDKLAKSDAAGHGGIDLGRPH